MEITSDKPIRRRKYDPDRLGSKCHGCKELGNLENLIRCQLPVKNKSGVELYQVFEYVYFCSESCQNISTKI